MQDTGHGMQDTGHRMQDAGYEGLYGAYPDGFTFNFWGESIRSAVIGYLSDDYILTKSKASAYFITSR